MGRIILYIAASLDGYIATEEGGVDWLTPFDDCEYGYEAHIATVDTVVLGRRTYDQVLGFGDWPYEGLRTRVLTHHQLAEDAPPETSASHDVNELIAELREQTCDTWLVGGGEVIAAFLKRDAIDRFELFTVPTLLGAGVRLFTDGGGGLRPRLLGLTTYENGVLRSTYACSAAVTDLGSDLPGPSGAAPQSSRPAAT